MKDKETFLRERDQPTGFALEAARGLASFIEATVVNRTSRGKQVTITLRLWLPDASAPQTATVVHQWDERRLNALSETEREQVMEKLTDHLADWRDRSGLGEERNDGAGSLALLVVLYESLDIDASRPVAHNPATTLPGRSCISLLTLRGRRLIGLGEIFAGGSYAYAHGH